MLFIFTVAGPFTNLCQELVKGLSHKESRGATPITECMLLLLEMQFMRKYVMQFVGCSDKKIMKFVAHNDMFGIDILEKLVCH